MSSQLSSPPVAGRFGSLGPAGSFGLFADDLLCVELPDLGAQQRKETVSFICRRAAQVPTPLRLGLTALTLGVGVLQRFVGPDRTTRFLRRTSLPFVGELARLVRSLGFTYVWETWPATSPTGASS